MRQKSHKRNTVPLGRVKLENKEKEKNTIAKKLETKTGKLDVQRPWLSSGLCTSRAP